MVEITVIVEGGSPYADAADVLTVDNSQSLRQSFNRIFSELLKEEVSIIVQTGGGYRNAASLFVRNDMPGIFLYVDLDDKKENIPNWFTKLEPIVLSESRKQNVFFMIQEMEAWFLKQSASIERWGCAENYQRLHPEERIEEHSLIVGKDIEDIAKPSDKLKILIRRFFESKRDGRSIKYGKLKSAPGLLDQLDMRLLLQSDAELQRFSNVIY